MKFLQSIPVSLALAACNPAGGQAGALASEFGVLSEVELDGTLCRFRTLAGEAVFATIPEQDTGVSALANYQRETLRLYNLGQALRLDGTPESAVYGVEEYPSFDVALDLAPNGDGGGDGGGDGYAGTLELRRKAGEAFARAEIAGGCGG